MTDRPILVVLDTSAVRAHADGSMDIGEVMTEVADEHGLVGVPLGCLVEAASAGGDMGMLEVLTRNPVVVVFVDEPGEWRALEAIHRLVRRLAATSSTLKAIDRDCEILTRTPELYAGLDGGGPIIAF